jgi:hypothetical protein
VNETHNKAVDSSLGREQVHLQDLLAGKAAMAHGGAVLMRHMSEPWPDRLTVRPLTVADAKIITQWRYDGPWKIYHSRPEDRLMSDNPAYLAVPVADGGPLIGFVAPTWRPLCLVWIRRTESWMSVLD